MPTYDYHCTACKHRFEQFQSMKDKPLRKCPSCGKGALERLIGIGAAVIFKGSGFYQTDYRSESYKKAAEADTKSAEPAPAAAASTEAKPATTKPESTPAKPAKAEVAATVKADAPKGTPGKSKSKRS